MDVDRLNRIKKLAFTNPKYTKKLIALDELYENKGSYLADRLRQKTNLIDNYNVILAPIVKNIVKTHHFDKNGMSRLADAMTQYAINHRGGKL